MILILDKLRKYFSKSLNLKRLEIFFALLFTLYFSYYIEYFSSLIFDEKLVLGVSIFFFFILILSFFSPYIIKKVRFISNALYVIGMSLVIYTSHLNRFNLEAFSLFIACFCLFSFSLSNIKLFLRVNAILLLEVFISLLILNFNTETDKIFFFITIFVVGFAGFCTSITRDYYKKRIKNSEKKYRDLTDKSIFGVFIFNKEKIVFANNRAISLLKYNSLNEIVGLNREEIIKIDDPNELDLRVEKIKKGENVPLKIFQLLTSTGDVIEVESKPTLIDFEGEECILSSFVEITDRKKIQQAKEKAKRDRKLAKRAISEKDFLSIQLEENRQIQRKLQNSQSYSEGIIESSLDMIFTTNIDGKIIKLNSAAKEQLQFSDNDFNNKSFELILKDKKKKEEILSELEKKNSFSGKVELKRKDNSNFPAFLSISHLYTTKGTFLGIMGVSRDISEIIAKEQEIKEQSSKLNAIIESSSHYFFSVNRNHRITSFNKLFINDVKEKMNIQLELMDDFFLLFNDDDELKEFWKNKFNIVFSGGSTEFEIARKLPDGKLYFREMFLNPIYGDNGKIEEVSGIGHDITEKKLYELELKKSIEEKEVLLKEVHHRVKNNLQVISSILNLQSTFITDESMLLALKESQDRIRSMATIHERLYRTKNFSNLNFSEYVKDLSESILTSYELSNISVELVFSLDEVFLSLNTAIPCGLIINELITNSLKYAFNDGNKGFIRIALQKEEDTLILTISDNGVGIPDLDFINSTGTLGLSLVTTLVEQIEGELKIDNESGSTFIIKFKPDMKK